MTSYETDKRPVYPRPTCSILDSTMELIEAVINDTEVVFAESPLDEPVESLKTSDFEPK